jgi:hypothetical protein
MALMSDIVLHSIAKESARLREKRDFDTLTQPWNMREAYADEVLECITKAREVVFEKYRPIEAKKDQQLREAAAARVVGKGINKDLLAMRAEEGSSRKGKDVVKKRGEQKRKAEEYDEMVKRGKRPRGRPPKGSSKHQTGILVDSQVINFAK